MHVEGATEDALLVNVGARGDAVAHRFAQRYRKSRLRRSTERIGDVAYPGEAPPLFGDGSAADSVLVRE